MEERIKYLFQRYLENSCSRQEYEEFLRYLGNAAHDEHIRKLIRKVYEQSGQTEDSLAYVDESGNLVLTKPAWSEEQHTMSSSRRRRPLIPVAVLAGMLLLAAAGWWLYRPAEEKAVVQSAVTLTKKSTDRSEYKYLLLPDSTQVWLNAASSLEFPQSFNGTIREVYLSGEAYFDVKHADKVPFIIHTGKITTTVLGTAFNIKAYPGRKNVIVSVSRGKVKVNYADQEVATLVKGQQVKVSDTDSRQVEKKTAVSEAAAWQQGNLAYDDESLTDIMADLERVYGVNISITSAAIRELHISTSFKREIGIEEALQVLCRLTDTNLKQADGRYIID